MKGEGKITEESLFKFMRAASERPLSLPDEPTTTLSKAEYEPDIFLDIFANDFFRVIKAFAFKRGLSNNRHKEDTSRISSGQGDTFAASLRVKNILTFNKHKDFERISQHSNLRDSTDGKHHRDHSGVSESSNEDS